MRVNYLLILTWIVLTVFIGGCVSNQSIKDQNTEKKQSSLSKRTKTKKRDPNRNSFNNQKKNNVLVTDLATDDDEKDIGTNKISKIELKCTVIGQCAKLIQSKIINLWNYRKSYPKRKTVLELSLSSRGHVNTIKLKRSSGERAFDDSVIKAVLKAEPFTEITYLPPMDIAEFSSIELVFKR